jgi:hypothetical protein
MPQGDWIRTEKPTVLTYCIRHLLAIDYRFVDARDVEQFVHNVTRRIRDTVPRLNWDNR